MQRSAAPTLALLAGLSFLIGASVAVGGESVVSYTVFAQGHDEPHGLLFLPSGDFVVAEQAGGTIAKVARIAPDGTTVVLLAGLKEPRDPVFDAAGDLYVAETKSGRILKLSGARW
jgi:glucose/arabinose dehydrogenase